MEKENVRDALRDLIAKGLLKEVVENGVVKYQLTPLGKTITDQLMGSIFPPMN